MSNEKHARNEGEARVAPARAPWGFFVLVFVLSLPFQALQQVTDIQLLPGLPLASLAIVAPITAAAVMIYRADRAAGVLRFLRKAVGGFNRSRVTWHLLALLIPSAVAVLAFFVLRWSNVAVPGVVPVSPAVALLFLAFLAAAACEELGWMGYAFDPLETRFGTLGAALVLGVVWAAWHFVALLQVGRSIEFIAWWTLSTVAMRVIMVWLYLKSGRSVLNAVLFHAMFNLSWQLFPVQGSYYDPKVQGLIFVGIAAAIVLSGAMKPNAPSGDLPRAKG